MKLIDFPAPLLAELLTTLERTLFAEPPSPASLATQEGLLKHAYALGRQSVLDDIRGALNIGAIKSPTASQPTTPR